MDDLDKKFFFIIHSMYYDFHVLSEDNQIIYENKIFHDGLDIKNNSIHIKKFLDENIFKIEKKFKIYIKDIYLILNDKDLLRSSTGNLINNPFLVSISHLFDLK